MNQNWKTLVEELDTIRKKNKISNVKLSEITGVDKNNVSRFFKGSHAPTLPTFLKIANALNLSYESK
jgi:transcriptional regulator with XRE-family HTH domain